jgi:pyruvate/2-oxoglutarate/acetoin dehydrogenase E1 component
MSYSSELTKAMNWLASRDDTVFLGQQVLYPGNFMFNTFKEVPQEKRIELPVAEDMQMGMSIGLSLTGKVPITIYPRINFLMCAMNQLVNHLDKMDTYSYGQFKPKVIVRVAVGSIKPLDPGVQHSGEMTLPLINTSVIRLKEDWNILPAYQEAYFRKRSTVLIEYADLYYK